MDHDALKEAYALINRYAGGYLPVSEALPVLEKLNEALAAHAGDLAALDERLERLAGQYLALTARKGTP